MSKKKRKPKKKKQNLKNSIQHYLILSFIGIVAVSILSFSWLGFYMTARSHQAFHQIGSLFMSQTSEQVSKHFESVINLRFDQVGGLASVVSSQTDNLDDVYDELVYRTQVRGFNYLALCSEDGEFQTLMGNSIHPLRKGPFLEALIQGEKRVAVGEDSTGKELVLFGVDAHYPMEDGKESTGLVAAVDLSYITDFLSLNEPDQMMYYSIIRDDGSVVIENKEIDLVDPSQNFPDQLIETAGEEEAPYSQQAFQDALASEQPYSSTISYDGNDLKLYSIPLSNSEWNLVSLMPYNQLNDILEDLNKERTTYTVISCSVVLAFMVIVYIGYYRLSQEQMRELEKSRQAAAAANRAKSEFLANMSHDIRTPMNAIVGMTAIATAHIDNKDQVKNCLRKITLSSKQLLGLINDVLDMSRIESGKMSLAVEDTSLKELIEGIVSIMQPQLANKKQNFNIDVRDIYAENVWCDGVRLNQVLLNLLSNATKYTPEYGEVQLLVREEPSPKGADYVRIKITVKDNGIGMTPEFLSKIYDAYSRADSDRIRKVEGTGLGMTITKFIVDAMGGTIDAKSEVNKGTQFDLTFDFIVAPEVEYNMVLKPWNMLVVDDDEFLCKSTSDTLKEMGIHAEWVLSGEQGINMALQRHKQHDDYQIILLDWKLPGMNGLEVARKLRHYLGDEVPILLISAYDWSEFEQEAREAGVSGFISKPLFKTTLFHTLQKYMGGDEPQEEVVEEVKPFQGRRILLAEDNDLNWEVASELLGEEGFEVEWAEDGKICLEKFTASAPGYYDAILMDLRMPNMNGYESAKAIRASSHPKAKSIPIVAMSADAFPEDIQRSLDSGMNAHIAKPIDLDEIIKVLRRFFDQS